MGEDGYLCGWEERAARKHAALSMDGEGYLCRRQGGRITADDLASGEYTVMEQMLVNARHAVGAVEVSDEWDETPCKSSMNPNKKDTSHVNVHVALQNMQELIVWWARVLPTAIYTLDGSRHWKAEDPVTGEPGALVVGRAAARHDGTVVAGGLAEEEGQDNYLAELAAQLDALDAEPPGGRLIVVFDATSPVEAYNRFRRLHHRGRQGVYVGRWYGAMEALPLTARGLQRGGEKQTAAVGRATSTGVGAGRCRFANGYP